MNQNKIMIYFLIFLSTFLVFLGISLSSGHSVIKLLSLEELNNITVNKNDYMVISESNSITNYNVKNNLKIYYIGSYNPGHICGQPQINSFFKKIGDIEEKFKLKVDIEGWYLDTVKTFTDKYQINNISRYVIKDILRYQPDIIYTTDDAAFEYIAIPMSKNFLTIFSGINNSYSEYRFKYNNIMYDDNMIGIDELVDLNKLYDLFRNARTFPDKWYFINDDTDISKYIYINLKNELEQFNAEIEIFQVKNSREFTDTIKKLNNNKPGMLVNNTHSLYSSEYKTTLDTTSLSMLMVAYNKTHLDFSLNKELCKYGISITSGPDYYKMGSIAGDMFIDILNNGNKRHIVKRLKSEITINYKRIGELPYYQRILRHLDRVDNIISSY